MTLTKSYIALTTLIRAEITRIFRIWSQTFIPPIITQTLYFVVFGGFVGSQVADVNGVSYMAFLVPGLIMMAVITGAFTNTVFSFFFAKWQKSLNEILVTGTPPWVIIAGYTFGGVFRAFAVGLVIFIISIFFTRPQIDNIWFVLLFMLLTAVSFALAGLVNAIYIKKVDQTNTFPTFVLTPLTYLGGVFYPISALPSVWQTVSKLNPIVYMIDGFRYGFYGVSAVPIWMSLVILVGFSLALGIWASVLIHRGTGIRT